MTMNSSPQEQTKLLRGNKASVISAKKVESNKQSQPPPTSSLPGVSAVADVQASSSTNSFNSLLPPVSKTQSLDCNLNPTLSTTNGVVLNIPPNPSYPESLGDRGLEMEASTDWKSLLGKGGAILLLLYLFVCSLGFLSDSFRLIAGRAAGEVLQKEKLIKNPIVGVMMGILVTVAVQSSSTSTSIVVSMVASGLFTVKTAIPIIMGANIGTSVTNTVVALTHMTNRDDFERAFSGAVLHDMFNLLTVSSLLLLEQCTSYLEISTTKIMSFINLDTKGGGEIQVLSRLTKPFTSLIIQLDKEVLVAWSVKDPKYEDARLMKVWCNGTSLSSGLSRGNSSLTFASQDIILASNGSTEDSSNSSETFHGHNSSSGESEGTESAFIAMDTKTDFTEGGTKCKFLFNLLNFGDFSVGLVLLGISLVLLCGCLILLVKVLSSLLKGKLAVAVQKGVNANIPYVPCLTGYLAIGIGAVMTILVQSSSVFTSAMTPLIAMGMISLERAYPLTLGSNLGTTTTAMLAALATQGPNLRPSIQLALAHFLFNLTGILLFYPLPPTRLPIRMAAALGRVTAQYRWFAVAYLLFAFLFLPLIVFALTLLGPVAFYCVATPTLIIIFCAIIINLVQSYKPNWLPEGFRTWEEAPKWIHSLEPYDQLVERLSNCWRNKTQGGGGGGSGGLNQNWSQARLHDPNNSSSRASPVGQENANFLRSADQSWIDFTAVRQQTRL